MRMLTLTPDPFADYLLDDPEAEVSVLHDLRALAQDGRLRMLPISTEREVHLVSETPLKVLAPLPAGWRCSTGPRPCNRSTMPTIPIPPTSARSPARLTRSSSMNIRCSRPHDVKRASTCGSVTAPSRCRHQRSTPSGSGVVAVAVCSPASPNAPQSPSTCRPLARALLCRLPCPVVGHDARGQHSADLRCRSRKPVSRLRYHRRSHTPTPCLLPSCSCRAAPTPDAPPCALGRWCCMRADTAGGHVPYAARLPAPVPRCLVPYRFMQP